MKPQHSLNKSPAKAPAERVVKDIPGTSSAFSERVSGGRYIEVHPDRIVTVSA